MNTEQIAYLWGGSSALIVGVGMLFLLFSSPNRYKEILRKVNQFKGVKTEVTPSTLKWAKIMWFGLLIAGVYMLFFVFQG